MQQEYPLLKNLMLADNDIHYVDHTGKRIDRKVELDKVKAELRKRKEDKSISYDTKRN